MTLVAIIPAAGKGTRVSPLPGSKEMFPIGFQELNSDTGPFLHPKVVMQYLIDSLVFAKVRRILIVISDNKWDIVRYYGNGEDFGISISYLFQRKLNGMPGALDLARPWLRDEDTVVFGMPDTIITQLDIFQTLIRHHHQTHSDISLGLFRTDTPERFGMSRVDESGNLTDFIDKPTHTELSHMWGIGCWNYSFVRLIGEMLIQRVVDEEPILSDFFALAIEKKMKVTGVTFSDSSEYLDIGTPSDLVSAAKLFAQFPNPKKR